MVDIHELGALDLASAFRSGALTPVDAVEHFLDRIERHNEAVGAFVTVTADTARTQAAEATRRIGSGEPLPPLYGVPTAIKDLNLVAGVPTGFGSKAMEGFVPEVSDEVVLRIERAGLISLGKTNTPEFGTPCYTESDVAPPARTPYDLTRSAGGSSGGAAAAVAAGLVPVAQGSDGGGSIRIPASVCGLVGLKPSRGRISAAPSYGDISGLAVTGPIGRSVRDVAALLDAMAGRAPADAMWAEALPAGETYLSWCDREPARLRIARFSRPALADVPVDPEVLRAYEQQSALLADLGHDIIDVDPPVGDRVAEVFEPVWSVMARSAPVTAEREHLLTPLTRWLRRRGDDVSGLDLAKALRGMAQVGATVIGAYADYDAVLSPTLAQLPAPVGALRNDADPAADFAAQKAFSPYTSLWNVTGMPAISLPTGWSTAGLPIGTMLAARPGDEHRLLALASQVEVALTTGRSPWDRPDVMPR